MQIDPTSISRFRKIRYLASLSEHDFRDKAVRVLFLRQGLLDGRDVCGVDEKGKDAIFYDIDKLGMKNLYAVQTKKGKINLSRILQENLLQAMTQIQTALNTPIPLLNEKSKLLPAKVILCCSGSINEKAREHITDAIKDPRLLFLDAEELIPAIDKHFPEFWLGINTEMIPYLQGVRGLVDSGSHEQLIAEIAPTTPLADPASDSCFVMLHVHRIDIKPKRENGKIVQTPDFQEIPITELLQIRSDRILVLGDAGSGKSTVLRRLAYRIAGQSLQSESGYSIPILVRAHDFVDQVDTKVVTTVNTLISAANKVVRIDNPCFSAEDLANGKLVLLIDSLDEIADTKAKQTALNAILAFAEQYPKNRIILAARDNIRSHDLPQLEIFTAYNISPISFKQAARIVRRFQRGRALPEEKCHELLRRLQEVHGMELNPLLVTVFAATSDYSRRDIAANITELFKKYTEMMLGRWNASRNLGQQFHAPLKDFLLCTIAFEMHKAKVTSLPVGIFRERLAEELRKRGHEADLALLEDELLVQSGLLRVCDEQVEFRHFLLQEFFAGRGIPSRDSIRWLITSDWWIRPLVFYFGQNPGESDVFFTLQETLQSCRQDERFCAAIAMGLALQACYLVELDKKMEIFPWVIESLVSSHNVFMQTMDPNGRYPLSRFITYYLTGRDAVACGFIKDRVSQLRTALATGVGDPDLADLRKFWLIVGLIEAGSLEEAKLEIEEFRPKNPVLFLPIHLGCYLILHLRVTEKREKALAEEIIKMLAVNTAPYRKKLLLEFRTEVLEIQKGKVQALSERDT
jgi:hypothetical protein